MQSRGHWVQASRCRRLKQCLCCVSQLHLHPFVQVFKSGVVMHTAVLRKQKTMVPFISTVLVLRLCFFSVISKYIIQILRSANIAAFQTCQHCACLELRGLARLLFCNFKMFSNVFQCRPGCFRGAPK